jgi:hypothetical protein
MPNFADWVTLCARTPEYVNNWARLRGISVPRTPMDRLIDDASGRSEDTAKLFMADAFDLWQRISDPAVPAARPYSPAGSD